MLLSEHPPRQFAVGKFLEGHGSPPETPFSSLENLVYRHFS